MNRYDLTGCVNLSFVCVQLLILTPLISLAKMSDTGFHVLQCTYTVCSLYTSRFLTFMTHDKNY